MPDITIAGALIPSTADTPLDKRARVASAADIAAIENPFVGMHVFVTATGREYVVKSLKAKTIGALEVPNAAIDDYEEVPNAADLSALSSSIGSTSAQLESRMTALESSAGAVGSATQLLGGRMTALESAAGSAAAASSAVVSRLETLESGAFQTGSANMTAGSAVPILAYEEIAVEGGTQYVAYLPPDTNLSGISSGSVLPTTLLTPDSSTLVEETVGSETVISTAEDLYQTAAVLSAGSGGVLLLESSLLNSACSSAGLSKTAVSGYTSVTLSGGTTTIKQYRVTLSGAGDNAELYPGRKIWTRAGSAALVSNSIDHTSGNYLFLTTSAPGTTAIYYGVTSNYIDVAPGSGGSASMIGNRNFAADGCLAAGEYNIVLGVNAVAFGAFNDVDGYFSVAAGDLNVVHGPGTFAAGNGNQIADGGAAIGDQNKLFYQGEYAIGIGNKLSGVGAITVGAMNTVTGYNAAAFGTGNTVGGKMAAVLGNRITNNGEGAVVLGYGGTVSSEAQNKRAVILQGGTATTLAARCYRNEVNPLYNPSLDTGSSGKDLNGEPQYNAVEAYRTTYRGQLGTVTRSIAVSGSQNVILDLDQYSRFCLTGSGTATMELANAQDGDRCDLILDSSDVTPVFPAEWVTLGVDVLTTPGLYVLEIAVIGTTVFYKVKYPDSQGGGNVSIGDHISITSGYWYIDGVNTGVRAVGAVDSAGNVAAADTVTSAGAVTSAGTVVQNYSGGETRVVLTQSAYDALGTKDPGTWYYIREN